MDLELFCEKTTSGESKSYILDQPIVKIGSLLSNQIVIKDEAVEAVHALMQLEGDKWTITNISDKQVLLNGKNITQSEIKEGDKLTFGITTLLLRKIEEEEEEEKEEKKQQEVKQVSQQGEDTNRRKLNQLFAPRTATPQSGVLEVVAYWKNQVISIEHFAKKIKGYDKVLVGDPAKCHFADADFEKSDVHVLSEVDGDGYTLDLLKGMTARVRSATGKDVRELGPGQHICKRDEISHVRSGALQYFFIYTKPQVLKLPPEGIRDPLYFGLMSLFLTFYLVGSIALFASKPIDRDKEKEDIWSMVEIPEKKYEKLKPKKKKSVNIANIKKPKKALRVPPKSKTKRLTPARARVEPKNLKKIKRRPRPKSVQSLTRSKSQLPKGVQKKTNPAKRYGSGALGAKRKGKSVSDRPGSKGTKSKRSSGQSLAKLGLGVGTIASHNGAGAIHTNFQSSSGGAGGGSGSANKSFGLGGIKTERSVGIAGAKRAINNFGGAGLVKGKDLTASFSGSRKGASINFSAADPLISGGLTQDEILDVIKRHQNELRSCYQKQLQKNANSGGTIQVKFIIGTVGRVMSNQIINDQISAASMKRCVKNVVKRMKFPQPRGGRDVAVTYPFSFRPV